MKKLIAFALAFALCFCLPFSAAAEGEEYEGYILAFGDDALLPQGLGDSLRDLGGGYYLAETDESFPELILSGAVESIEPNYKMSLQGDFLHWNMDAVKAPAAWEHLDGGGRPDMRGDGVIIAVIDSGIYAEHPDLAGADILDWVDLSGAGSAVDTSHGTQVAGILAAGLKNGQGVDGAVPNVSILPIRITLRGATSNALAIEAVNLAVEMGADVINLSVGGKSASKSLEAACDAAAKAGVIVVCAAGNYTSGTKSEENHMYPASFESTISVSACKAAHKGVIFDSSYSYFNNMVDVAAPGTNITSLDIDGGITTGKGSSFSAPHVSALAAMLKQHSPDADINDFRAMLEESSLDLGTEGRDNYYGWGFIDTEAFIALLENEKAPIPGIRADELSAAGAKGERVTLSLENAEIVLSPEAASELGEKGSGNIGADFSETEKGLRLSFYDEIGEISLSAPLRLSIAGKDAIASFSAVGDEFKPVSVSMERDGKMSLIIPGSGYLSFEAGGSEFSDLGGHWAAGSAAFVADRGIFKGDNGKFLPSDSMTRAMFATVLGRIYEGSYGAIESSDSEIFSDCDYGSWYGPYVDFCYRAGIVQGDGKGNFDPTGEISRAQMAAMIQRFAAFLGLETDIGENDGFSDSAAIPAWAADGAGFCRGAGIMGGMADGSFAPSEKATRAQCAAVIERLIGYALS